MDGDLKVFLERGKGTKAMQIKKNWTCGRVGGG